MMSIKNAILRQEVKPLFYCCSKKTTWVVVGGTAVKGEVGEGEGNGEGRGWERLVGGTEH